MNTKPLSFPFLNFNYTFTILFIFYGSKCFMETIQNVPMLSISEYVSLSGTECCLVTRGKGN